MAAAGEATLDHEMPAHDEMAGGRGWDPDVAGESSQECLPAHWPVDSPCTRGTHLHLAEAAVVSGLCRLQLDIAMPDN